MALPMPNRGQLAVGIALVITLVVVGGVAWGFGQQLTLAQQMRAEERRLEQAVATEQARHEELGARVEYVGSDEYVERWAREEAKMSRPGEVVVIPIAQANGEQPAAETQSQPEGSSAPDPRPFWVKWWELLFEADAAE